jgi:hypothetical protein
MERLPLATWPYVTTTASLALQRCDFWAVFTRLGSAVRVATLPDFSMGLKHAVWWQLLQNRNRTYIMMLTRNLHWNQSWPSWIKSKTSRSNFKSCFNIIHPLTCRSLKWHFFLQAFLLKILHAFLICPMPATSFVGVFTVITVIV